MKRLAVTATLLAALGAAERMAYTVDARDRAEEETGERKSYLINVTAETNTMLERADVKVPLFVDQLRDAKELGPISVYACTMAMELMGRSLDDYVDVFDDELGVAGFLNHAMDKQVIFI